MNVLGIQGSPRPKGNSHRLLERMLGQLADRGARTVVLEPARMHIEPCKELVVCEKKGTCPIQDEMETVYGALRQADVVVVAAPVFFYNVPAQLKALVDRCQVLWARKYRLGLQDPAAGMRQGFLLSVGATSGKQLFAGIELTCRYFFDAVDAAWAGSLTWPGVEKRGAIDRVTGVDTMVEQAAARLAAPFAGRKQVVVADSTGGPAAALAAGLLRQQAGKLLDVGWRAGTEHHRVPEQAVTLARQAGLDLAFWPPADPAEDRPPDLTVFVDETPPRPPAGKWLHRPLEIPPAIAPAAALQHAGRWVAGLLEELGIESPPAG